MSAAAPPKDWRRITFALLAIGPLLAAAIVLTLLPETAGVSLEELNRDPSAAPPS